MKKSILLTVVLIIVSGSLFAETGYLSLGLGFQYGRAWVVDKQVNRDLVEPGLLATIRGEAQPVGFFARIGLLFPSELKEGELTLKYSDFDYLLFINGGLGINVIFQLNSRFSFLLDAGMSINDLLYGGSYRENIDARWEAKLENIGKTYSGGRVFHDVKMSEVYNDVSIGILGNVAFRFNFTKSVFLELGGAASFDFLRFKSYKFAAKFDSTEWADAKTTFPEATLDDVAHEAVFESDTDFSVFKQFTFIPSISVGFRF